MDGTEKTPCEFVLYENDGLVVTYTDRSMLELAPCASCFVHVEGPSDEDHVLQGQKRTRQQTEFVTSRFKDQVMEAIEFRNLLASRPCVIPDILDKSRIVRKQGDFLDVPWPRSRDDGVYETQHDGSASLLSLDGHSRVELAPCRQFFTLCYLAPCPVLKPRQNDAGKHEDSASEPSQTWVFQHHSVSHPPDFLRHPLSLLLNYHDNNAYPHKNSHGNDQNPHRSCKNEENQSSYENSHGSISNETDEQKMLLSKEPRQNVDQEFNVTRMPRPLSSRCQRRHLHKWRVGSNDEGSCRGGRIKAVCSHGIIYRLRWEEPRGVEAFPGDGSVLRSKHVAAHYFQHYVFNQGRVEERLYSAKNLPPSNKELPYSIPSLITMATQLMEHLRCEELLLTSQREPCCWQDEVTIINQADPPAGSLLEEIVVPGLGRFRAYASGRVRVVFSDRTCLDTFADFSTRTQHCLQHSDNFSESQNQVSVSAQLLLSSSAPLGVCDLLLPDGSQDRFVIDNPGKYSSCAEAVRQWIDWVSTPPEKRGDFYRGTLYDPGCMANVSAELTRIKCFNYLVDEKVFPEAQMKLVTTNLPTSSHNKIQQGAGKEKLEHYGMAPSDINMLSVMEALQSTSRQIAELDNFLKTARNEKL